MAKQNRRSLPERLQELIDALRDLLSPRQPAPVPIPVRSDELRRR